ncbi:MAG: PTS fructose transporter subunit IIABC [Arthrobacter sp.]|uniref:PTS fructose transporter subunit IIABC n=1 Tax=unclassified Arthrobacter TaxID=235627 RepID=UPI00264AF698|nr:fructose-specific PTS transporter subunit EIIC [Micrococcaceae bacterium]
MSELITADLVLLDRDLGTTSAEVIRALAAVVTEAGRATSAEALAGDGIARESKTATGVPGGIGIPHCRSTAVTRATLVMARLAPAVDFGAKDGPADLVFFIAAPEGADQEHLKLLSKLARSLVKKDFTAALRSAGAAAEIVSLVDAAISPAPAAQAPVEATAAPEPATGPSTRRTLVAVTACPTGIAHTYMAADSLVAAAADAGVDLQVETQGSSGSTPLDPAVIAAADAVIFAVDVDVKNKERFAGLPVIQVPVKRGVDEPAKLVADALAAADNPQARRVPTGAGTADTDSAPEGRERVGAALKRSLLTGVSYMIPFVAGGGLLIALGFLLGGYEISDVADQVSVENNLFNLPDGGLHIYLAAVAFKIGNLSMGFLVPVLAGYIAYALADRPGLAPGFTAGAVAGFMGAGFLGGIIGGLLAGVLARWIGNWRVPKLLRGLMPVVIIPLIGSILASGAMFLFLGGPIAALSNGLNSWLSALSGSAAALVGLILGLMMAVDLGGPINKVAYSFAVAGLGAGSMANQAPWEIMAAVMAAGMVPPLALALATALDKKRFSAAEQENGKAAWLLGAAFISEGAIPFAAADPLRVIPASMLGAGVTGAMIMGFHVTSQAPHGGMFVFFAIGNVAMFIVSIIVGMVISALAVLALKRYAVKKQPASEDQALPVTVQG